jgi:hypothetical protein
MPDIQIRNEKLQDIKHEQYLLRHIWSGVISGFLGLGNEFCALLVVYLHRDTAYPSRNVSTKLTIYAAEHRRRAPDSKLTDSAVHITVSLDITSLNHYL